MVKTSPRTGRQAASHIGLVSPMCADVERIRERMSSKPGIIGDGTLLSRRALLAGAGAAASSAVRAATQVADDIDWTGGWSGALATLARNIKLAPQFDRPILFEGAVYHGCWQECGPHESLGYAALSDHVAPVAGRPAPLEVARNTHLGFFANQRPDGQLPANLHVTGLNFSQIQMVVPIAATAWETAQRLQDEAFLSQAYTACSRWDEWLRTYRNTRGTGLVEAFCTYDTGQDNSPRWAGVSDACPDHDARKCPPDPSVPRLCPDLSATVFGARVALSAMAAALGRDAEARKWRDDAEHIRALILKRLWCEEDASFYDVAPDGTFVRVRSVGNLRVLGEHVLRLEVSRELRVFEALWDRQLRDAKAYWTRYPFPSIALDDPKFVRPIPFNSWGGAAQALTAYRTLRWMDHYGKSAELDLLLRRWCEAISRGGFCQQVDPDTGVFTKPPIAGYSPAALVFLHGARRLGHAPPALQSGG